MNRISLDVDIPGKRYAIQLGKNILNDAAAYPQSILSARCLIVSNETVAPLYLDAVRGVLAHEPLVHILPDGEQYKSMEQLNLVLETMLRARLGRDACVIALGGGVVGDLAGFAAAIYQRGVRLLQIPTTLLSQVDSSVGGKTAVNHPLGKNMIGAFHQPDGVITDLATLDTLPEREFKAGVAEVIKYGLIGDADFFAWLESNMPALLARDADALAYAIASSCRHKARVVAADEKEQGHRALLNLGHTFGHAIEAHQRYLGLLHGEAVAVGMCMAADLSWRHGWIDSAARDRVMACVRAAGLPTEPPSGLAADVMLDLMQGDKKVAAGRVRLVLLDAIGQARLVSDYDDGLLTETLKACCSP